VVSSVSRLVWRAQRKLQSIEPIGASGYLPPNEVAELEARVRRLHAIGDRFSHVRLSPHVIDGIVTGACGRVGGECVAKEV
jgi:hypothetical protein